MLTATLSAELMELEDRFNAHNYHPLPVVLSKGRGVFVWDADGKRYFDFLSAYSAVNQGHCHPKIIGALIDQAQRLTLTSRAFYNDQLCKYDEFLTDYFGFDRLVLAQASLAHLAEPLAARLGKPVLSSPELMVRDVCARVRGAFVSAAV